jgi:hypothetical protein
VTEFRVSPGRVRPEVGEAFFSADRMYRYALSRCWDGKLPMLGFIGLNPSTADETRLDPTLRRVVTYAIREGCGGIWVANLFAYRATKPKVMLGVDNPVGPHNDVWLTDIARWCGIILCGWGAHGSHLGRDMWVRKLLQGHKLHCLSKTKDGQPGHPLYLRKDAPLQVYQDTLWRPGE